MARSRRLSVMSSLLCAAAGSPSAAVEAAEPPAEVIRYEVLLPTSSYHAGAARTVVAAPLPVTHSLVTDYAHYSSFIKAFETSKIVGRNGEATDVYLRVKILKGAAKIWAIVRFNPAKLDGATETVSAQMVKGNVKRLDAIWHLTPVDDEHTRLTLELLIIPDLPVPEALVVPEVRDAAATAVRGVRDESARRAVQK